jgi:hypothetical protein
MRLLSLLFFFFALSNPLQADGETAEMASLQEFAETLTALQKEYETTPGNFARSAIVERAEQLIIDFHKKLQQEAELKKAGPLLKTLRLALAPLVLGAQGLGGLYILMHAMADMFRPMGPPVNPEGIMIFSLVLGGVLFGQIYLVYEDASPIGPQRRHRVKTLERLLNLMEDSLSEPARVFLRTVLLSRDVKEALSSLSCGEYLLTGSNS